MSMTRYVPPESRLHVAALLVAVLAASTSCADPAIGHPERTTTSADGARSSAPGESSSGAGEGEKMGETWNEIDRLVEDGKYREALERASSLLESVRGSAAEDEWELAARDRCFLSRVWQSFFPRSGFRRFSGHCLSRVRL